jgi:hypothetical protein
VQGELIKEEEFKCTAFWDDLEVVMVIKGSQDLSQLPYQYFLLFEN